jgi:hypothetical protein
MAPDTIDTDTATEQQPNEQLAAGAEQQLAPAPSKTPVRLGMSPTTPEEGWRLAQILAASELVPKIYRKRPADILVAIQYGIEIGFAPMQALQSIAVINGRASVWGDGFLALLMSSPLYRDHNEYYEVRGERRDGVTVEEMKADDTTAVCTFWRRGKATPVTRRFSIGQARKSGLLGKEGPWSTYPDRMMAMRARSWAGRDAFPDLLRGIRTAEEAQDTPEIDVIDTPQPVQPRRASEARQVSSPQPSASPAAAAPTSPPAPASPASVPASELRGMLVTNTCFVRPKAQGAEPYYEITMQAPDGVACTFLTRSEQVYKEAASFEGSEYRVAAGYHTDAPNAGITRVLDAIALDESTASGQLFR